MNNQTKIPSLAILGGMIRSRRKRLGFTQVQAAALTGFSPRLIGEIERGRGTVGFDKVLLYANGVGIDLFAAGRGD